MEVNSPQRSAIHFGNVFENETFTYPLILVHGFINVPNPEKLLLRVYLLRNGVSTLKVKTQVHGGRFLLVLDLNQGRNEFRFDTGSHVCRRTFYYRPVVTDYVVTPMYIQCQSGNDDIDQAADMAWNLTEVCDRITLGCRLIQTVIAETLYQSGFGRKTFSLEQADENGNNCIVFNSKLNWSTVLEMTSEKLWEHLGREIMVSEYGRKNRKFLAFFSSRSKEHSQHLAIGGGGLALCDAKYLQTWPTTIDDINLSCNSQNNTLKTLIKSSFSTSLGAVCHELCHTFDLGHTVDGIMGRDFDRVGALFTVTVPATARTTIKSLDFDCNRDRNDSLIIREGAIRRKLNFNFSVADLGNANVPYNEDTQCQKQQQSLPARRRVNLNEVFPKGGYWFGGCATLLAYHRWINHTRNSSATDEVHADFLQYDHIRSIVTSIYGIVIVQLRNRDGYILKYWEFYEARRKKLFLVPICEVRRSSCIVIEDTEGNLLKQDIENVL